MRSMGFAFILLLAVFFVGCSGTVGIEGNPDFEWEGYGTYDWWPEGDFDEGFGGDEGFEGDEGDEDPDPAPDPVNLNTKQNDQRIRQAIDNDLNGRGFSHNPGGSSDLEITFYIANNKEINPDKYGYHWWKGAQNLENRRYPRGTLVIDVINPKDHQLVWRGVDRDAIHSPDEDQKQISQAVRRIMNKFPHR